MDEDFNGWSRSEMIAEIVRLQKIEEEYNKQSVKYRILNGYFKDNGFADIVKNLTDY